MDLIIGGCAQGKLEYAKSKCEKYTVVDERDYRKLLAFAVDEDETLIWNHLHLCIRDLINEDADPGVIRDYVLSVAIRFPNIIIISDEVGSGIVPVEKLDRAWREETGRVLCRLASEANRVERVICQIPTILK